MNEVFIYERAWGRWVIEEDTAKTGTRPLQRRTVGATAILERPGPGKSIVFLHGIGSSADSFAPLFGLMPAGPRLIAWNAPGYLSSARLSSAHPSAADYAARLDRLLTDLGLEAAHIVGHSLGTLIAAAFAAEAPDRASSLTLAASAQGYGTPPGAPLPEAAQARLADLQTLGPAAFADRRASRLVYQPDRNSALVAQVQAQMARIDPEGYAQAVHMLAAGDLAATMAQVRLKPGFIIGAEDVVTPMAQTDAARHAWAVAHGETPECIVIPGAGHAVYLQAPKAFAAALHRLLPDPKPDLPDSAEGDLHGG